MRRLELPLRLGRLGRLAPEVLVRAREEAERLLERRSLWMLLPAERDEDLLRAPRGAGAREGER